MNLSLEAWRQAILYVIAFILSVSVHEFGHAWVATRLGDALPRSQGRLTLNPRHHIDPIGTLVFPLLMAFGAAPLAWGRPVWTNPANYTRRLRRSTGSMLVAIAGPIMNLILAALVSAFIVVGVRVGFLSTALAEALVKFLVSLNLSLMFFNLLPIPPLDGGAVLAWLLPRSMQGVVEFLSRWGFLILVGLMMTGTLATVMSPAYRVIHVWTETLWGLAGV